MPARTTKASDTRDNGGRPAGQRIHTRVAEELGIAIVTGKYSPGSTLPNELEASERLNVSRPAYREAVRILAAKGLVRSRPKAGTTVNPRETWNLLDPDVLAWMFQGKPSKTFIRNLFELRSIIEPAAAALAAERRSAVQLSRMGYALEQMARHGVETPEGRRADEEFHSEMLGATGNEAVRALADTISAGIRWSVIFKLDGRNKLRDAVPDHRAVYAAIADQDPERARSAMLELLRLALDDTRSMDSRRENRQPAP